MGSNLNPTEAYRVPTFLGGELIVRRGTAAEFRELEPFHYRRGQVTSWAAVWAAEYEGRLAGVAVLSYPTLRCLARERALGWEGLSNQEKGRRANAEVRTIRRVIVHPTFRGAGVACALIRCVLYHHPVRWMEGISVMERVAPVFGRAGMRLCEECSGKAGAAYLIWDAEKNRVDWTYPRVAAREEGLLWAGRDVVALKN